MRCAPLPPPGAAAPAARAREPDRLAPVPASGPVPGPGRLAARPVGGLLAGPAPAPGRLAAATPAEPVPAPGRPAAALPPRRALEPALAPAERLAKSGPATLDQDPGHSAATAQPQAPAEPQRALLPQAGPTSSSSGCSSACGWSRSSAPPLRRWTAPLRCLRVAVAPGAPAPTGSARAWASPFIQPLRTS